MAGIPISLNFDLSAYGPIDSRTIATNSYNRNSITYLYPGLKVYQSDINQFYTWNGSTWSSDPNGIYGGSGSLLGNTNVNLGYIGNTTSMGSYNIAMSGSMSSGNVYLSSYFNRHTNGIDWNGVEYRTQYTHDSDTSNTIFISYNPLDTSGSQGGLGFGTGNKTRLTIKNNGTLRIWSPTYSADILLTSLTGSNTYNLPNKSGIIALTNDLNLNNITTNGNTTTNFIQVGGLKLTGPATFSSTIIDSVGSSGSPGQVLSATAGGVKWMTLTNLSSTTNSLIFYDQKGGSFYSSLTAPTTATVSIISLTNSSAPYTATYNFYIDLTIVTSIYNPKAWRVTKGVYSGYTYQSSGGNGTFSVISDNIYQLSGFTFVTPTANVIGLPQFLFTYSIPAGPKVIVSQAFGVGTPTDVTCTINYDWGFNYNLGP